MPGELVIIVQSRMFPEKIGSQTEIIDLKWVLGWADGTPSGWGYKTKENANLERASWCERQLSKLPPETPATFDAAIWAPSGVSA